MDPASAHMDISNYYFTDTNVHKRPESFIAQPINATIDLGYMAVSNHLTKRFHEARMEITNINTKEIELAYTFSVDNKTQQSSYEVFMEIIDGYMTDRESISFDKLEETKQMNFADLEEISLSYFENFKLDLARFPTTNRLDLRIPVNGRGRVPRLILSLNVTNDFEIFKFTLIYKEQTGRMVSQR